MYLMPIWQFTAKRVLRHDLLRKLKVYVNLFVALFFESRLVPSKIYLMFRSTLHVPVTVCKSFGCNFILWVRHATFKQCRGNSLSGTWKRFLSKAFQTSSIRDVRILPAKCASVVDTIDFNQFYRFQSSFRTKPTQSQS